MSSLHGPEGREDKNGESAARSTMDAESEVIKKALGTGIVRWPTAHAVTLYERCACSADEMHGQR